MHLVLPHGNLPDIHFVRSNIQVAAKQNAVVGAVIFVKIFAEALIQSELERNLSVPNAVPCGTYVLTIRMPPIVAAIRRLGASAASRGKFF